MPRVAASPGLRLARWVVAGMLALVAAGCPEPPSGRGAGAPGRWQPLGSWHGRGDELLSTFFLNEARYRVRWRAEETVPGAGRFRVTLHSSDSGRLMEEVVDHSGSGDGVRTFSEEPRRLYFIVEASGVNWSIIAEEYVPPVAR
jgi:hypothetical protein